MPSIIIVLLFHCLINSVLSKSENQTKTSPSLNIHVAGGDNDTLVLFYNVTTNYSYLITFRLFGDVQLRFGVYSPTNRSEAHSIAVTETYRSSDPYHLLIVCFHFILPFDNLDIHCRDIRFTQREHAGSNSSQDLLPSYNPLFVPMMYALSIVMLLPMIIQHHHHKKALLLQRRQTLKRLSIHIAQDEQHPQQHLIKDLLSRFSENGEVNFENLSLEMEPVLASSTNIHRDDSNDNNVTFTLHNLQPFIHRSNNNDADEQVDVNADDCIAHLLDNTPWNTSKNEQPLMKSLSRHAAVRDCAVAIKEQHVPTTMPLHDDDDDSDQKPILKTSKHSTNRIHKTNRVFFETDV